MNLQNICEHTITLVKEVGQFIHQERKKFNQSAIQFKGKNDLVTYVDTTSEQRLVEGLHRLVPEAGFLTEEKTTSQIEHDYQWVVDPLDGTTNYVHGVPFYSISVALMLQHKVVLGVVYSICLDECFYAWENSKAYLNGQEIRVSATPSLQNALLVTGFPYSNMMRIEPYLAVFKDLLYHSQGVRRLGSAAGDLAYVACGRFEAFYEYNLCPWDVAAGSLIVQQAGGRVVDFQGKDNYIFGKEIIAANPSVYQELLQVVQKHFPIS